MTEEEIKLLDLNVYQSVASRTAVYPKIRALEYLALGLTSEAGEVAGKVKKVLRDDKGVLTDAKILAIGEELGDCLWYISELARVMGVGLMTIGAQNLVKLASRHERGVIGGSGDTR